MTIVFEYDKGYSRVRFDDVEYVEVGYSKDKGRLTRFWFIYTKDGKTHSLKFKDHTIYWIREG